MFCQGCCLRFLRDSGFASRGMPAPRVFRGMPALAWPGLAALIGRKLRRGGAGCSGAIQHPGVWDGAVIPARPFIAFSTLHGARFAARVRSWSPPALPCPALPCPWFPVCLEVLWGTGRAPWDNVADHGSRGDIPRAEGGVARAAQQTGKCWLGRPRWGCSPQKIHLKWLKTSSGSSRILLCGNGELGV